MTLDPVTRAACAEALAGASAETLREDARLLLDVFREVPPTTREDAAWMRAAALALAVAAVQEDTDPTIIAALAAIVEGA